MPGKCRIAEINAAVVVPPVFDFYATRHRFSALGAHIVGKILKENGCTTTLFNFPASVRKGAGAPLPPEFAYLKPFLVKNETGKLSFFTRYQRFGPGIEECARQVLAITPNLVLISCFAFAYAGAALELAAALRRAAPDLAIAVGGAGVSCHPQYFIRRDCIDFAFTGEAEVSLPAFIFALRKGEGEFLEVPNLFYKKDGRVLSPDSIRRTAPEEVDWVVRKTGETRETIHLTTALSRGCIKKCRFCSNFLSQGRTFRKVPLNRIRSVMEDLTATYPPSGKKLCINFEDDNLLLDPDYFFSVMEAIKTRFPQAVFCAENGIDHTFLTEKRLQRLMDMGFAQFNLSIASARPDILKDEARPIRPKIYEAAVQAIHLRHIPCITYFICGFAKDTPETIVSAISRLAGLPTLLGISLFYPVPGLPDYEDMSVFDSVLPQMCAGSAAFPWNRSLTTGQLITAFRLTRLVNLLKSKTPSETDRALLRKIRSTRRLYTLVRENKVESIIPVPAADEQMVSMFFDRVDLDAVAPL